MHSSVPKSPQRSWTSLAASSVVHVGLLALVLFVTRQNEIEEEQSRAEASTDHSRETQMVYLPPPPEPPPPEPPPPQPPPPPPEPRRETPPPKPTAPLPPPVEQKEPEPEANAPPDAVKVEGEESDKPEGGGTPEKRAEEAARRSGSSWPISSATTNCA